MSEELLNERAALASIYSSSTLLPSSSSTSPSAPNENIYILVLPSQSVSLRLSIPTAYPAVPPVILGTDHVGEGVQKGYGNYVLEIARSVLKRIWIPDSVCLFDLIEELESALGPAGETEGEDDEGDTELGAVSDGESASHALEEAPPWVLSEAVTVKKSVFLARAARVESPAQAKAYIAHLVATDKKVARATHNISAYRIRSSTSSNGDSTSKVKSDITFQDGDSDGEDAAGGRLLHLLQAMGVWDVVVVVSRWYGGIKLGPDRFRIINSVARDAIVQGGWAEEKTDGKKR
ncbi:eIF2 kinase Gcn2p negative regulator, partial [Hypocenomyce scalaris]|nr:eIF2 kinase Gcn2p negative regulator [Hypocenomyce scalaris]